MNITRNAMWLLGCRIIGDLLNLGFFVVISRAFGPSGVGAYSYGFAVTGFVLVIGAMGLEEYGTREYSRMEAGRRPAFIAQLLGVQVITVLVAVLSVAIYLAFTSPSADTLRIMLALSIYQVAQAVSAVFFIPAMGGQHMMERAVSDLACRAVSFLVAGVAIYLWHMSISMALMGYIPAGAVLIWLSARSARRHGGPLSVSLSMVTLRSTVSVIWSFAIVDVVAQLFFKIGIIVLTLHMGATATGLYATGLRMIEAGLMPTIFMGIAVYPQLSRAYHDNPANFQRIGLGFLQFVVLSGALLTWGLYFVAPVLLVPVLGPKYAGAEPVIMAIAVLAILQALELGMGKMLFAADRQVGRAAGVCLGAAAALILNLLLVPRYGVSGAIWSSGLSCLLMVSVYFVRLKKPMRGTQLLPQLLIAAIAGGVAYAAAQLGAARGLPVWMQAAGSAVIFLLIVAGGMASTKSPIAALGLQQALGRWWAMAGSSRQPVRPRQGE